MRSARRSLRAATPTTLGDWYAYPQYFELGFASETPAEAEFVMAAHARYGRGSAAAAGRRGAVPPRLLDLGCGGGRLVRALAQRGWLATGLDSSLPSVRFAQRRLARYADRARVIQADMADFRLPQRVDVATCTFDTFRHLTSEAAALANLRCVNQALHPGGIYILGLHLLPPDAAEECCERWSAERGKTRVACTLRVLSTDRRARREVLRTTMLVRRGEKAFRVATEFPLRMYTARQLRQLLAQVPELELCDTFDFWYEIDSPLALNNENSDTVLVLRKRSGV